MVRFLCIVALLSASTLRPVEARANPGDAPFLPTWRLLSADQKQQFIAGYLYGWGDAAKVVDIVIGYVRANPDEAIRGLEKLRDVYGLADLKAASIVREIDQFYADPANGGAGLPLAINAARGKLR